MSVDLVDIPGCEGRYAVHPDGCVFSYISRKYLKPGRTTAGYRTVNLRIGGKSVSTYVHILVAQAFIPNPENKPTVNHQRGVEAGDAVDNLEWMTYGENHKHAYDVLGRQVGYRASGADNPRSRSVRSSDGCCYPTVRAAAAAVGVTPSSVAGAAQWGTRCRGLHWEYVS